MAKIDLIKLVARNLGVLLHDSTVKVATNNTLNDDLLLYTQTEQLKGRYLYAYGTPTHIAFSRLISDFTSGATPTIQVSPSWGTNSVPTIGQSFLILDYFKIEEIRAVTEEAIKAAGKYFLSRTYATLQLIGTQYEYVVPSGFAFISDMHFVPSAGNTDHDVLEQYSVPRHMWRVENSRIVFNPEYIDLDDYDKEFVRIIGQSRPALLADDESTFDDLLEQYLVAHCVKELSWRRMGENQGWAAKYAAAKQALQEEQDRISTGVGADAVRVE